MMQDYKQFIAEINRLEVQTKQLFVKDGRVLYEEPVEIYLEKDPKGERWPGHLSFFYDFDQYSTDNDVSSHEAQLTSLRDLALVDLLSLPAEQLSRFLADLKAKRDRMSRLAKIARELDKEYFYQQFDKASSLQYNLFEALKISQPVGVSLDASSARHLWQAVAVKRNELTTIVNQIDRAMNPGATEEGKATKEADLEERITSPILFINPDSRQDLYTSLKKYIIADLDGSYQALYNLIFNNQPPDSPIIITGLLKEFGLSFHSSNAVPRGGASTLSEQLPKYFIRNDGRRLTQLMPSILVKHLRGKGE